MHSLYFEAEVPNRITAGLMFLQPFDRLRQRQGFTVPTEQAALLQQQLRPALHLIFNAAIRLVARIAGPVISSHPSAMASTSELLVKTYADFFGEMETRQRIFAAALSHHVLCGLFEVYPTIQRSEPCLLLGFQRSSAVSL